MVNVSGGYDHSLAATADGAVYAWGYNGYYQLGIGDGGYNSYYDYPMHVVVPGPCPAASPGGSGAPVPGACGYLTGVTAVAAGYTHSIALKGDGTVYAWGYNGDGQVGNGTTDGNYYDRPVQVVGAGGVGFLTGITAIAAGEYNGYALRNDGTVWAWGNNDNGELGNNNATGDSGSPVQVLGPGGVGFLTGITAIAAPDDGSHALALRNDGTVWAWGNNGDGELGDGTSTSRSTPVQVVSAGDSGFLTGVKGIAAGTYHSLALMTDGSVYAWGYNGYGQLGNNDNTFSNSYKPVQVRGVNGVGTLSGIAQIAAGEEQSVALTTDGRVVSWGEGDDGEMGNGYDFYYNLVPVAARNGFGPGPLTGISFIDAGGYHTLAIASATATPSVTALAFGNQTVGTTSAAKAVTITNGGSGPLTITGTTITGANAADFAQNGGCAGTIQAGGSCTVNVTFTPAAINARTATLSFATNAGQVDVALTGTGVAVPVTTYTVTASASGSGTVTPNGTTNYNSGNMATYTATAGAGQTFVGWTLDGTYVGYHNPLDFTVTSNRTLVATFVATPQFSDLGGLSAQDRQAIVFLAALGIVNPQGVNGSGQFQPNADVQRTQVAAFIARTFGWQHEFHANNFPDKCDPQGQHCIDDELWNNVAALKDYGVVGGYADQATCQSAGTTAPCYLPRDVVQRVQVVSVVARAFTKTPDLRPTGFWDRLNADPAQYTNVPNTGTQRADLTTYRANVGTVPGQTSDASFGDPNGNGSRLYMVQVLYAAFNAQFGVDRVP